MEKISAIIITKNEQENIHQCLESIKWVDEIIIVDSGSSDKTLEIAANYTDKIFFHEWQGYAIQKRYALSLASNEWVLSVDADEIISEELKIEISSNDFTLADGFYIRRNNFFLGKLINSCGWDADYQLRLFKKLKTTVTDALVHEGFHVDGKTVRLNFPMFHYTNKNLFQSIEKSNYYSSLNSLEKVNGKKINALIIMLHTLSAFLRYYFSLKGFKDGIHGLLISWLNSLTTFQAYAKTWEKQNQKSI